MDIKDWLKKQNAYAVASNQLGYDKAFFVASKGWKKLGLPTDIFFNPTYMGFLSDKTDKDIVSIESCLSYPDEEFQVARFSKISCVYYDIREQCKKSCVLEGLPAIVFQHETDHLVGLSCVDSQIIVEDSDEKIT